IWLIFIKTLCLGFLIGGLGDRQIAGGLVDFDLPVSIGKKGEEFGNAFVFFRALAAHHPKRGAADDRVLRRTLQVGIIGHGRIGEVELGLGFHVAEESRRRQEYRAFARGKAAFSSVGASGVVIGLVLLQLDERLEMLHL